MYNILFALFIYFSICYLYVSFLRNFRDKLKLSAVKNAANIYDNYKDILEYKSLCFLLATVSKKRTFEAL